MCVLCTCVVYMCVYVCVCVCACVVYMCCVHVLCTCVVYMCCVCLCMCVVYVCICMCIVSCRSYRTVGDYAFMKAFEDVTLATEDWTHEVLILINSGDP